LYGSASDGVNVNDLSIPRTARSSTGELPTVAIVGRPNVGKSTIFNRLVGRKQAIVHDEPGVTRDRNVAVSELSEGRPVQWIDTGGLVGKDDTLGINDQVRAAIGESDLLLFIVDARDGLLPADREIAAELRPLGKPLLLVVNKTESRGATASSGEFFALGLETPILIAAEHGQGFDELRARLAAALPPSELGAAPEDAPRIAIVGRPNVGKSSLVNRILGENRVLVSPVAGTTRDPIDTLVEKNGKSYLFVDTAGIRKRAKVTGTPEDLAVLMARRQLERADLAILVVEAPQGVTSSDIAIAGAINEAGRAAVVVVNKWDLLDDNARERLEMSWPRLEELLSGPPRLNLSATTGRGAEKLFPTIDALRERFELRVQTAELNRLIETAVRNHSAPTENHRPWKFFYSAQVTTAPPTFMLFANRALPIHHPYRRYLENRLREELDLGGVPIRLVIRSRREKKAPARRAR
jgi:GTP-binding protein